MAGSKLKGQADIQDPIIEEVGFHETGTDDLHREIDKIIEENIKIMMQIREKREQLDKILGR